MLLVLGARTEDDPTVLEPALVLRGAVLGNAGANQRAEERPCGTARTWDRFPGPRLSRYASPDYSRDALDYGPSGWMRAAFALRAGGAPILTTIRRNAWCSAGLEHHRAGLMNNPG